MVGGLAMSEVESGSDVLSMKCRAEPQDDGGFVLTGSKYWCTNGPDADVAVIYAKSDPDLGPKGVTAFLVDRVWCKFTSLFTCMQVNGGIYDWQAHQQIWPSRFQHC